MAFYYNYPPSSYSSPAGPHQPGPAHYSPSSPAPSSDQGSIAGTTKTTSVGPGTVKFSEPPKVATMGSTGHNPNKCMMSQPHINFPPGLLPLLETNFQSLQAVIGYTFTTDRGVRAAQECLIHPSVIEVPEGNTKLARLGESALKTNGIEQLYLEGRATGAVVAAMESSRFTVKNLSNISRNAGLPALIVVGGSRPHVSDKMAAQVLQAALGAVYIDGGMEALGCIASRLNL